MGFSDWFHLDVSEIIGETDRALLVRLPSGRDLWIPLSVISDPGDYRKGIKNCTISIKDWWAQKAGVSK